MNCGEMCTDLQEIMDICTHMPAKQAYLWADFNDNQQIRALRALICLQLACFAANWQPICLRGRQIDPGLRPSCTGLRPF